MTGKVAGCHLRLPVENVRWLIKQEARPRNSPVEILEASSEGFRAQLKVDSDLMISFLRLSLCGCPLPIKGVQKIAGVHRCAPRRAEADSPVMSGE